MPKPDITLYHAWPSSASRKVRFCLREKGLDYLSIILDIGKLEHHADWYKQLNPSGVVPALVIDGEALVESNLINEYLDERFPDPPLRPSDPLQRHDMRLWSKYIDETCLPAIQKHNWMMKYHPMAREWSDEELERRLAAIPTENRRHVWYRMARDPYTEDELDAALDILRDMADRFETRCADGGWLVGGAFSLADINATPYAMRLAELAPDELSPAKRPHAAQWWAAVQARPAFALAEIGDFMEQSHPDYQSKHHRQGEKPS